MQATSNQRTVNGSRQPVDADSGERAIGDWSTAAEDCDVPLMVGDNRPPADWGEASGPAAILDVLRRCHRDYGQWLVLVAWFGGRDRQAEATATWLCFPLIMASMDRGMSFDQGLAIIAW